MSSRSRLIDQPTVDRIFTAANIVEVVSDFVQLRKKGVNYQANCPFHNEKTPSFVVSPTKGLFKCFGCGKGGNAVTFVMEHEGVNYVEALKYVAKKYGIEVAQRELSPEEERKNDDRESMLIVTSYAAEWFEAQLRSEEGVQVGLSYFKHRGFTKQTIEKFALGYCPERGESLSERAVKEGYKEEFLVATGLSGRSERAGAELYDRFYGRVIFPIHAVSGRILGFGGRTMRTDTKTAKYINSPESEIYHKSSLLYGLFFAKRAIMQQESCILVEGYTDVISMHQAGVENVVASSGTALTTEQIRLIKRFTKDVTMIFDGDAAGVTASLRGVDMVLREEMNVRVVLLPEGEDPDSFARSHDQREIREYIEQNQQDFISFKTAVLMGDAGDDPIKKGALIGNIVGSIAEIPDPIMRSLYTKETARRMGMDERVISSEVARKRISHGSDRETQNFIKNQQQIYRREEEEVQRIAKIGAEPKGSSMEELERELVKYLIIYGDRNFEYKEGDKVVELNVAQIIINDLQANGLTMRNSNYRALYESYLELYEQREREEGENTTIEQQGMQRSKLDMHRFINHPEPEVCNVAVDILTDNDNYVVSRMWQRFDIVVDSEQDRLAQAVPRAVILYKSKAIESIIKELKERLRDGGLTEQEMESVVYRIAALNRERISISRKLSRLIL